MSVTGSDRYCSSSWRVSATFVVLLFCNLTANQLLHLTWESNLTTKVRVLYGSVIVIVRFGSGLVVKLFGFVRFGSEWPRMGFEFGVFSSIPISTFQWAQDEHRTLSLSPQSVAQKRSVQNLNKLSTTKRHEIWCQLLLITNRSRTQAFDWYLPRWPWMTLSGVIALILRFFTEFDCFAGQLRHSG